jgi:hypothetical protein
MSQVDSAYVHRDGERHVFAIRVKRIATLTALGLRDEQYQARLLARHIDWLTCLINLRDERVAYDMRLISAPCPELYVPGRIEMALLCRVEQATEEHSRDCALDLLRLCESFFEDEYELALVSRGDEIARLLQPFPIRALAETNRRVELARLDTLQAGTRKMKPGFTSPSLQQSHESDRRVYHIYPFIPNPLQSVHLFKLLLMQDEPLAISFRLRPSALGREESDFLEQQIHCCERYAQVGIREAGEKLDVIYPTLQEQARAFQRHFTRSLYALKDNAAILRVEIAAPRRVPQTVVDLLGAQLTQPSGGLAPTEDLKAYLSGGYEFNHLSGESLRDAAAAFCGIDTIIAADTAAPPGAERLPYLFDAMEATSAFRFPSPALEEIPGLPSKTSRTQLAPSSAEQRGHLIGHSVHNGRVQPVRLSRDDRRRHLYAVGQTGTGKTSMFESMIMADIKDGEGLCVIDPHGDLIEKLLAKIPEERAEDIVLFDPRDMERPVGFNMLDYESEEQKYFLVQEIIAIIEMLLQQWDPAMGGPIFYQYTRMVLLLVMSNPDDAGTLIQFHHLFNSRDFYKRFLPLRTRDPLLEKFVSETLLRMDFTRPGSEGTSFGNYVSSKFDGFTGDPMLRNIFGQQRSTINLREIMDGGKILLVNLSKGQLGELNARFLGMVIIAKLQAAALARAAQAMEMRRDFYLYVDEFQNLATLNFGILLSEARKYRLNLILTNQYVAQVDPRITQAIAGNAGTTISFRVGPHDAELLEREFAPVFNRYDLVNPPNFHTYVSTLTDGQVSKPFSMRTNLDESESDSGRGELIRELSRMKYGKRREEVERSIAESLRYDAKSEDSSFSARP